MMNPNSKNSRQQAMAEFLQSLDALEATFSSPPDPTDPKTSAQSPSDRPAPPPPICDFQLLEDAAADLDRAWEEEDPD
jgi:hypothetical protein